MAQRRIRVVSYRRVFKTEWRLTRVWEFDLTKLWPGGIPVSIVAATLGTLLGVWLLSHIPPTDVFVTMIPGWFRYGSLTVIVGVASQRETPDGRTVWAYLLAQIGLQLRGRPPREPEWVQWDTKLPVRWDGSGSVLHRGQVTGPASIQVNDVAVLGYSYYKKRLQITRSDKGDG